MEVATASTAASFRFGLFSYGRRDVIGALFSCFVPLPPQKLTLKNSDNYDRINGILRLLSPPTRGNCCCRQAGQHDDTALFIGCPDVDLAYKHLRAHGVAVEAPVVASYGMKQLYLKDPDGFTLCFQWAVDAPAGEPVA
jgi:hypothetical protein